MKTESNVRYVLRLTVTLLLIATVVAVALAVVNQITAPEIAKKSEEKVRQAIETVLPGGYDREITQFADETGMVKKVYAGANGYALEVHTAGFDGELTLMVGVPVIYSYLYYKKHGGK